MAEYVLDTSTQPLPEAPTKEGHTFAGWYYGTEAECNGSCEPYTADHITGDTNLHAHFVVNVFTVTYDTKGGTSVENANVDWNTAAPMPETTLTGYNFVGWFRTDGTQYNGEPVTGHMTLTAHWEVKIFTVTFYANGEVHTTMQVPYGTQLVEAMAEAKIVSMGVVDKAGLRVSKMSVITEDTEVLVHKLSGTEKFGDWISRNMWAVWTAVAVVCALAVTAGVAIAFAVKRG